MGLRTQDILKFLEEDCDSMEFLPENFGARVTGSQLVGKFM